MTYSIATHRHRFAAWAAARAMQRRLAGATVPRLIKALGGTQLQALLTGPSEHWPTTPEAIDSLFRESCGQVMAALRDVGVEATYGRAAKLVSVYIKAMVVCAGHESLPLAQHAPPPIDRMLLQTLAQCLSGSDALLAGRLREIAWTDLDEAAYWDLVGVLRQQVPQGRAFWELEEHWDPDQD